MIVVFQRDGATCESTDRDPGGKALCTYLQAASSSIPAGLVITCYAFDVKGDFKAFNSLCISFNEGRQRCLSSCNMPTNHVL